MKVVFLLLFFLIFAESKWIPAQKVEDLPAELQPYVQLQNGKFMIKNGAKLPMRFENGQFAFKFTKEKCKAGIYWLYTTITGKIASPSISGKVYKNSTGEGEVVVMPNGRNILDNQEELAQQEAFKLDKDEISLVEFEINDPICDVTLSQGKLMVERAEVHPPVEDAKANMGTIIGCVVGGVVLVGLIVGFLGYWFGCRKKKKIEVDEEKLAELGPVDKSKKKESKKKKKKKEKSEIKFEPVQISDRSAVNNFKTKQEKFEGAIKKYGLDLVELGGVCDYIKKTGGIRVCSSREGNEVSLKMTEIGGAYDFHDDRKMNDLEIRLLKESSKQGLFIISSLRSKADHFFQEHFSFDRLIPTRFRHYVKDPNIDGFYQAVLFAREFDSHLAAINTLADLKLMPIQGQMCAMFRIIEEDFLLQAVTLLKYRMLVQFQKLTKDKIQDLQWPINTYAKWYFENGRKLYLREVEVKDLQAKLAIENPDLKLDDYDLVKNLLV
uniref:Uncharacterized protein n=1 Tax=Panagrolaimus sp. JU765 TaxID=591449 RepID=A0AC34QT18_9BILA